MREDRSTFVAAERFQQAGRHDDAADPGGDRIRKATLRVHDLEPAAPSNPVHGPPASEHDPPATKHRRGHRHHGNRSHDGPDLVMEWDGAAPLDDRRRPRPPQEKPQGSGTHDECYNTCGRHHRCGQQRNRKARAEAPLHASHQRNERHADQRRQHETYAHVDSCSARRRRSSAASVSDSFSTNELRTASRLSAEDSWLRI